MRTGRSRRRGSFPSTRPEATPGAEKLCHDAVLVVGSGVTTGLATRGGVHGIEVRANRHSSPRCARFDTCHVALRHQARDDDGKNLLRQASASS